MDYQVSVRIRGGNLLPASVRAKLRRSYRVDVTVNRGVDPRPAAEDAVREELRAAGITAKIDLRAFRVDRKP
jgi:hypothetical protein